MGTTLKWVSNGDSWSWNGAMQELCVRSLADGIHAEYVLVHGTVDWVSRKSVVEFVETDTDTRHTFATSLMHYVDLVAVSGVNVPSTGYLAAVVIDYLAMLQSRMVRARWNFFSKRPRDVEEKRAPKRTNVSDA